MWCRTKQLWLLNGAMNFWRVLYNLNWESKVIYTWALSMTYTKKSPKLETFEMPEPMPYLELAGLGSKPLRVLLTILISFQKSMLKRPISIGLPNTLWNTELCAMHN